MANDEHSKQFSPDEVPTLVKRTIYLGYGIGEYNAGQLVISDYEHSSTDFATVRLATKELSFKIPKCKVDVKKRMIEVLEEKKKKVIAENHMRLKDVQGRIDQLKCLEYKPA